MSQILSITTVAICIVVFSHSAAGLGSAADTGVKRSLPLQHPQHLPNAIPSKRFGFTSATVPVISPYVLNPLSFGADPSGVNDSTAALQACVTHAWNSSRGNDHDQLDLGNLVINLAGGVYLLNAPVVIPSQSARNFLVRDGTLRASATFPSDGFLLVLNGTASQHVENVGFSNLVFDGGNGQRGGGLYSQENIHVRVDGCWFLRFGSVGLSVLNGHETYVDNTWVSQATLQGPGCYENGTGISLKQADASISNVVVFCTKLGIRLDGGNVIIENTHIYNTGHYHYKQNSTLMPFGAIWSHYCNGLKIIGCYFDDTIVVLDNPSDVIITASNWLVGMWNTNAAIVLRPIQPRDTPRPILSGLRVTDNYARIMPSFPKEVTSTQFIWFDEMQGKFNDTVLNDVVIADNLFNMKGLTSYKARSTRMSRSIDFTEQTLVVFDFAKELLYPHLLSSVQYSVVFLGPSSVPYHAYRPNATVAEVHIVFDRPASGTASVNVCQSTPFITA